MKQYTILSLSVILVALSSSANVVAEPAVKLNMTPGLWEQKITAMDDDLRRTLTEQAEAARQAQAEMYQQMQQRMQTLSPEQREQMEDMLSAQGINLSEDDPGLPMEDYVSSMLSVTKTCVTQAQIDDGFRPEMEDGCESDVQQLGSNRFTISTQCRSEGGGDPGIYKGEFEMLGPKAYRGIMQFNAAEAGGVATGEIKLEGRWLGEDCGNVKPTP